jgi:hypothetical protein
MDAFFENVFPLIPILLIVAFRFLFSKRKRAGERGQENTDFSPEDTENEADRGIPLNAAQEARSLGMNAVYEEDSGSGEEFSAWDLPVNPEPPPPPPPPPRIKEIVLPLIKPETFTSVTGSEASPPAEKSKPAAEFPGTFAPLSPLQRAMAWAEILGPPKGLP